MPFFQQKPRIFSRQNVEALNRNQIGVYGIFCNARCIYIGKGDIRERLLDHLNGDNPSILLAKPTHWIGEVTNSDPTVREKQLILEFNPECNRRIG